jgi:hypothetical protein
MLLKTAKRVDYTSSLLTYKENLYEKGFIKQANALGQSWLCLTIASVCSTMKVSSIQSHRSIKQSNKRLCYSESKRQFALTEEAARQGGFFVCVI